LKFDFKFNLKFVIITLIVSLVIVPILFNIFFMWDSGLSRGETSDWFTLYGNIIGGLIGGFFTYLALLLTLNDQKVNKKKEMRPRIDIPYQNIEFIDTNDSNMNFEKVVIELNNIGGSIAKNIECTLSIPNFEDTVNALKERKDNYGIHLKDKNNEGAHLLVNGKKDGKWTSLGGVYKSYNSEFIGSCIPLVLNHEAKAQYILENNVSNWVSFIVKNRSYSFGRYKKEELFDFDLEIKYSSYEFGDITDYFKLNWEFIGIMVEDSKTKYQYILKCIKVDK